MKTFKVGDRVVHINHGAGKIIMDSGDQTSVIVRFDNEPKMWHDKELEVSISCLKLENKVD